jgi:hypothetical protein
MKARANAEVVIGLREAELVEEHPAHVVIVVLPGMDEDLFDNSP